MTFVDSVLPHNFDRYSFGGVSVVNARVVLTNDEFNEVKSFYRLLLKTNACLNEDQEIEFAYIKSLLKKTKNDSRVLEIEKDAKDLLLGFLNRLDPGSFENFFPYLKYYLSRSSVRGIFEKMYLTLLYNRQLSTPQNLDFLSRYYLERLLDVFNLLKPFLLKKQVSRWEQNIVPRLRRF